MPESNVINVCRSCLAVNPQQNTQLSTQEWLSAQAYEQLLGIPASSGYRFCEFCSRLLIRFSEFRARAFQAAELLRRAQAQGHVMTKDYYLNLIANHPVFKPRYVKTHIIAVDVRAGEFFAHEQIEIADVDTTDREQEIEARDDDIVDTGANGEVDDALVLIVLSPEPNDKDMTVDLSKDSDNNQNIDENVENSKRDALETPKRVLNKNNAKADKYDFKDCPPVKGLGVKTKYSEFTRIVVARAKANNFEPVFLSYPEQVKEIEDRKKEPAKRYKCHQCGKRFSEFKTMERHKKNHELQPNCYICDLCCWVFKRKITLKAHLRKHSWLFKCKLCSFKTNNYLNLGVHSDFHNGRKYTCKQCPMSFNKKSTLFTHVRLTHTSQLSFCELCGELFNGDKGLMFHKKLAHVLDEFPYECEKCERKFMSETALNRHVAVAGCQIPSCVRCGDSFANEQLLKHHLVKRHFVPLIDTFDCDSCQFRFYNVKALERHSCGAKILCAQCGEEFNDSALLTEHVFACHDIFKCDECDKTFSSSLYFKRHCDLAHAERRHRQGRPRTQTSRPRTQTSLPRTQTTKRQRNPAQRKVMSIRKWRVVGSQLLPEVATDGLAPEHVAAICELCGKGFKIASQLTAHLQRCHSDNQFCCSLCQKSFKTKQELKLHWFVHSGARPHSCARCRKAFKTQSAYYRHQLVHSGEKRHVCALCSRTFQTSTSVKAHIRTAHMHQPWPKRDRKRKRGDVTH